MIRNGVDIIEISRFSSMRNFDRFLRYAFTQNERDYILSKKNPFPSAAASFAAKEAFAKYLGSGIRGFGLKDIEVLHDESGAPYLMFMGKKSNASLSISHSDTHAVAAVCGETPTCFAYCTDLIKTYKEMLPKRYDDMHKGSCGRLLIAAGSQNMSGAGCLASNAALRCGCGLVTLALPLCIQPIAAAKLTEVMTYPLPCTNGYVNKDAAIAVSSQIKSADALAIGPGLGKSDGVKQLLQLFVSEAGKGKACVIDADGLNVLSENTDILKNKKNKSVSIILTPHPKEMERLCKHPVPNDYEGRIKTATEFAKTHNVVLLLKGRNTVVAAPNGEYHINRSGNDGMATAGMGDVLTGVIASFCAQGVPPYNAAILGAFVHGLAGDLAAEDKGRFGMVAGDVTDNLPYAVKYLSQ